MALSGAWDRARNNSNNHLIPWKHLEESSIVVTGSTGLIGSQFVRSFYNIPIIMTRILG